eukprot:scaffold252538_cov33-Attheya_sp.AAC.1
MPELVSAQPSTFPSVVPSALPSAVPSTVPSLYPSTLPSLVPSTYPSFIPSAMPSRKPSVSPSTLPSSFPSYNPSTAISAIQAMYIEVGDNSTSSTCENFSLSASATTSTCFDTVHSPIKVFLATNQEPDDTLRCCPVELLSIDQLEKCHEFPQGSDTTGCKELDTEPSVTLILYRQVTGIERYFCCDYQENLDFTTLPSIP